MIKLKNILFGINESMSVHIKDADYTKYDTLWDLSSHLQRIAYAILEKLPPDQKQYFQRNRPAELLTIDGLDDMDSKTGILNLYYSGYTQNTLETILKEVKDELKKLNIKHGEFKLEQSNMYKYKVIRIPILGIDNKYEGAPTLNMSNRNAFHIFKNVLQFEPDDDHGASFSVDANELKQRVESILKHDPIWVDTNQIDKKDSDWPSAERGDPQNFDNPHDVDLDDTDNARGARMIGMGLDSSQIKERLYELLKISEWAIKHGKTELYVS